ncbi:MAG: phosphatidylserine decarboxylase [Ruminococcus sp.]|nr:phosphatidylserine decarboxylase [Ruminococcus sp.]MDE6672628.1 phosphatidylserine decarboxylase [Ruminococcus sp.]
MIKNRKGEIIAENKEQNRILTKLYGTTGGRIVLKFLIMPVVSHTVGNFMDSPFSIPFIKKFIEKHNLDTSDYVMKKFYSYNEFFTRRIRNGKRVIDYNADHLISPCDSKLSVYRINRDSIFRIKDSLYRVSDMLANEFLARRYDGGYCFIYRLEVDDYHRYCYIDDGSKTGNVFIQGELHTVNPIALKNYNIYKRNSREYTVMHTDNFGDVVHMEVGAMMVGRICNHHGEYYFSKGEEKGMFKFGGSTIVQLFEKNTVRPDTDIIRNTRAGFETVVHYGEKVGKAF